MPNQPRNPRDSDAQPGDLFTGQVPILDALKKLRLRLLDLTRRNRLLNFKHSPGRCIQFVQAQPDVTFNRLIESPDKKIILQPIPEPLRNEWIDIAGRRTKPDAKDYARKLGINPSFELTLPTGNATSANILQALYYPEDLERYSRKLQREMKSGLEETGAHMLFLIFGFLEFPEQASSDRTMTAPLISVPVIIEKGELNSDTRRYRYHLYHTGDEVAENLSLRAKLLQDHGFELPTFDADETTPDTYFEEINRTIRYKDGWKLKRQMTLSLLSFTKMLLVRDLVPTRWPSSRNGQSELTDHPIVRMVFEGVTHRETNGTGSDTEEAYDVDTQPNCNIPLIYDADSCQHSALIDGLSGRNMVVVGPPGTGKSQTITNLIAAAIAEGKKVLFLSEKMAALEVVKKRLTLAGLGDFCLELHSNKTQKKHVLDSIATRKNERFSFPNVLRSELDVLEDKRRTLKGYADLMNSVIGNAQGLSVHSVLWKAERYRQNSASAWQAAQELTVPDAYELTEVEFNSLRNTLVHACQLYRQIGTFSPGHPFWGFFPTELMPGSELRIERIIRNVLPKLEELKRVFQEAGAFFGEPTYSTSFEDSTRVTASLDSIMQAKFFPKMSRPVLSRLFSATDPKAEKAESALRRFEEKVECVRKLRTDIDGRLNRIETLNIADGEAATSLRTILSDLGVTGLSCESVLGLSREVHHVVAKAHNALQKLEDYGRVVGVAWDGSKAQTKKICALVEIALSAPLDLLPYRHEGLKRTNVGTVIENAQDALQRIKINRELLSELLYLDMIPNEVELNEAILVLREGDAWYRIFQRRWRHTCRLYRSLDRTKVRATSARRLQRLENLLTLQKVTANWNANQAYRDALGPFYQGEDTSFEGAAKLVLWLTTTQRKLVEAGLDNTIFNPFEVTEARLVEMATCSSGLQEATADLNKVKALLSDRFSDSNAVKEHLGEAENWPTVISLLDQIGTDLKDAANRLLAWSPGNVSVTESLQAISSYLALPEAMKSVDEDTPVRSLFGNEFCSNETNTQPAWDALAFGRKVIELQLPSAVTRSLLSEKVDSNIEKIHGYMKAIQSRWKVIDGFEKEMAGCGRFDLTCWAGARPSDGNFLPGLVKRNAQAAASINELFPWVQYIQQSERARERDLGSFISLLESGDIDHDRLPNVFGYRFYTSIAAHIFGDQRLLRQFSGAIHNTIQEEFRALDREVIKLRGKECAHKAEVSCNLPNGTGGARLDDKTELALINYLLPQTRPRMAIRKMMKKAGGAIQAYKPCFLMGPQAVAQFLEPGTVKFDMVVMDEASQLKPEVAIGAIARGKQLIVVGDPKQLPPTSFFDRLSLTEDDGEDDGQQAAALLSQSILDVCLGHFRPVRTLRWHYRSRHESLIAFSNHHFYKNLIILPSPYPKAKLLGVHYRYVPNGIYQDQINVTEAKHVTDAVIDHMLHHPENSLGVVTLNLKQRDLIEELLDQRFRDLPQTEEYRNRWEQESMGFFVKNLETVQGDERDVIFISTTFGKVPGTNVVRQNFGPISRPDGWRRLNVLFTRARNAIQIFTSMRPEDVIVDDNTPQGTRTLRDYLEYARSGILADMTSTGGEAESDFELALAEVLRNHGFEVEPQLGIAGFRIDIAVKHPSYPSAYLAAIECDGATYHSGLSVRDRDRIRQEILESLGWEGRIWRIWSTDWFRDPRRETAKLISFLNELKVKPLAGAYFVQPEEIVIPPPGPTAPGEQLTLEKLGVTIIETEDYGPEIEVGDTISYSLVTYPEREVTVRITQNQSNPSAGLISETHPLAKGMLGAHVGDEVTLTDERGQRKYIVKTISKAEATHYMS